MAVAGSAGEHWHVRGELARDDEAALVLISGNLRPRGVVPVFDP